MAVPSTSATTAAGTAAAASDLQTSSVAPATKADRPIAVTDPNPTRLRLADSDTGTSLARRTDRKDSESCDRAIVRSCDRAIVRSCGRATVRSCDRASLRSRDRANWRTRVDGQTAHGSRLSTLGGAWPEACSGTPPRAGSPEPGAVSAARLRPCRTEPPLDVAGQAERAVRIRRTKEVGGVVWESWQLPHSTRRAPAVPNSLTLVGSGVCTSLAGAPWPVIDAS